MRSKSILVVVLGVFAVSLQQAEATTVYNDGDVHDIISTIHDIDVYDSSTGEQTTVNLLTGGFIEYWVDAFDNTLVNISGGARGHTIDAWENSQITITSGIIYDN